MATISIILFTAFVPVITILIILFILDSLTIRPPHPCDVYSSAPPTHTWQIPTTAYSSTPDQTDSTPFITANGEHVYWGTVAANFLPFKTCIRFPDMYGDKWFVVEDRKHARFSDSIDIWFPTRKEATKFGFKVLKTEIWRK